MSGEDEIQPRRVLVTAGAAGVGRVSAEAFAREGWQVWVCDVDGEALADCPAEWRKSFVDVSDPERVAEMFATIQEAWGGLEAVFANAGVAGPTAKVEDVEIEDWKRCIEINVDGVFLVAKHAAPIMKAAGQGAIVVTSSTAGVYGYPNRSPYCASKWAVIGLTKTLAMELGPFGIRANVICPGSVEGPRMERVMMAEAKTKGMTRDQVYEGYASGTSMGRFVEARDIAEMAVFLSSDASRLVSGQVISVDGQTVNPDPKV